MFEKVNIRTKIKFKLWGDIFWLDKYDHKHYCFVPKDEAIYRWAPGEGKVKLRFKRAIQTQLKKRLSLAHLSLAHILLDYAWIEEIERKKVVVQKQLKLFPRTRKRSQRN